MTASTQGGSSSLTDESPPVRIREASSEQDAWYLQRQWNHWFGAEYESGKTLQHGLFDIADWKLPDDVDHKPLDTFGVIAEHAPHNSPPVRVGAGLALLIDHSDAVERLPDGRFDGEHLAGQPTVWFQLGVVDEAWRGRGIGSKLFACRMEWARKTEAEIALSCGWERKEGGSSRSLFEEYGWVPVQTIEEGYAENRTSCPDCGVWPSDENTCSCAATLWALDLPEGGDS